MVRVQGMVGSNLSLRRSPLGTPRRMARGRETIFEDRHDFPGKRRGGGPESEEVAKGLREQGPKLLNWNPWDLLSSGLWRVRESQEGGALVWFWLCEASCQIFLLGACTWGR